MKKFLSLVMALIMVMSLVTVASAADYKDAADIDKAEAVEVMSAVGVFQGSAGKFNPKAILNRAEAAKLIAYLDLGEKTAEALPAVKVFDDVPASHWAAKFIAYCADAGYINGVGGNKFDPAGKLTGYQFGKLVLCVLGYDATIEAFTGANWSIAVAKLMKSNDINDGVAAAPSGDLTREDAAQYCLNALKATMVEYADKGTNITINGAVIATGASKATAVVENGSTEINGIKKAPNATGTPTDTVELGEKLYDGDLVKKTATDDFTRSATEWVYDGDSIGKYATAAKFVFTADTSASKVAAALKGYTLNGYKVSNDVKVAADDPANYSTPYGVTYDATETIAKMIADETANGSKTEIFADSSKQITKVLKTDYAVAKVKTVTTKTNGDVVYTLDDGTLLKSYNENSTKTDNFVCDVALAKNDMVTYYDATGVAGHDYEYYVYPTTSVTGVVTEAKDDDYAIVDGTEYPLKGDVDDTVSVKSDKVKLTIDQFGTIVKSSDVDKNSDAVFLAKKWTKQNAYDESITMGQFVDLTGKVTEMQIEAEDLTKVFEGPCQYYVTSDDTAWVSACKASEVKLLSPYHIAMDTKTVKTYISGTVLDPSKGYKQVDTYYYLADDVTIINMETPGAKLKVTVSTGVQKIDDTVMRSSYIVVDDTNSEVIAMFVPAAANAVAQDDLLFIADSGDAGTGTDKDGKSGKLYEMYKGTDKFTAIAKSAPSAAGLYAYSIEEKTGRYELSKQGTTNGVYSVYLTSSDVDSKIMRDTYLTLSAAPDAKLAADCKVYDVTDSGFDSLLAIRNYLKNTDDAANLRVFAVYNDKTEVITALYIAKAEKGDDGTANN